MINPNLEAVLDENGFYNVRQSISGGNTGIYRYKASTGKIDKLYKVYNDSNKLIISVEYDTFNNSGEFSLINDMCIGYLHGKSQSFYLEGKKSHLQEYRNGLKQGMDINWDPEGHILYEYHYKKNLLDSCLKIYYYGTTQLKSITWFKNDYKRFDAESWYPDGSPQEFARAYPKEVQKKWRGNGSYEYISVEDSIALKWERDQLIFSVKKDSTSGKWQRKQFWPNGNLQWKEVAINFFGDNPGIRMNYDYNGKYKSTESLNHSKESEEYNRERETGHWDRDRAPDYWSKTILPKYPGGWDTLTNRINRAISEIKIKRQEKGTFRIQIEIFAHPNPYMIKVNWLGSDKLLQTEIVQKISDIIENGKWSPAEVQGKTVQFCVLTLDLNIR